MNAVEAKKFCGILRGRIDSVDTPEEQAEMEAEFQAQAEYCVTTRIHSFW